MPKLNAALLKVGVKITAVVGTMWTALFFLAVAIGATPNIGIPLGVGAVCVWFAQVVCQLVLLPIIMVGQNIQGAKTEALIEKIEALAVKLDGIDHQEIIDRLDRLEASRG